LDDKGRFQAPPVRRPFPILAVHPSPCSNNCAVVVIYSRVNEDTVKACFLALTAI
jgi:hypothetical protein